MDREAYRAYEVREAQIAFSTRMSAKPPAALVSALLRKP
jgi:hypothetical protein